MLTSSIRDVVRHPPFRMQKTPKGTFTVTDRIKRVPFPSVTDAKGPLPTVGIWRSRSETVLALQVLVYYLLYGNRHYSAEVPDGSTGGLLKTTRGKRTTTTKAKFEREVIQTKHIITYFFVNTRYISSSCLPWSVFGSSLLTMLTLANIS